MSEGFIAKSKISEVIFSLLISMKDSSDEFVYSSGIDDKINFYNSRNL